MKQTLFAFLTAGMFISCGNSGFGLEETFNYDLNLKQNRFDSITLEMSLKSFQKNDKQYISGVCREAFTQWASLLRHTDTVSVFVKVGDGSNILEYSGDLEEPLEWGRFLGNPNAEHEVNSLPNENLTLHERAFTYMEDPPSFTYNDLKYMVSELKRVGRQITGHPVKAGIMFDPGPEFAKSDFKYKKHPEACMAATMGTRTFLCCYATLNADPDCYAGFPNGIPQDLPFGTFLGRQSQHFLSDLGFDYIWFSNGFGFGMETWKPTGALFDGKEFHPERFPEIQEKIIHFWELFRAECPDFRIETRGTNLATGIDLAADGVDLRSIYRGGYNILPPPNSPWAALNGDFGLELAGYMSRIVELPDERYLFRFYTHDPWWVNSPWLDRYAREPHDIYLPMAVSRIDKTGATRLPTHLNVMNINDSYGNMPVQVADEVTPHLLQARRKAPDQPGPVVWIYPFDEYHDWIVDQPERIEEIYYGDWFIRQAINEGFPLNTVVSTANFTDICRTGKPLFDQSVLVTIAPSAESELEEQLIRFVKNGGQLMVYGPVGNAGDELLKLLNIRTEEPVSGEFQLKIETETDQIQATSPTIVNHDPKMSGGGMETVVANPGYPDTRSLVQASQGDQERDLVVFRKNKQWNGGAVCYIRGTNSASYKGGHLLTPHDPDKWFSGAALMRYALAEFGCSIFYKKQSEGIKDPINCISRHDNAYFFSGFVPNLTVEQKLRFSQGAPLITGWETELEEGCATYRFPKAFFEECRVFVEQKEGILSCFEVHSGAKGITRRIGINGLQDATVRIFPPKGITADRLKANVKQPNVRQRDQYRTGITNGKQGDQFPGSYVEFERITGQLIVSW